MRIAIYAFDGISLFHLAVLRMVFGEVTSEQLVHRETDLFTDSEGSVTTAEGHEVSSIADPDAVLGADVVVMPAWVEDGRIARHELQDLLRQSLRRAR